MMSKFTFFILHKRGFQQQTLMLSRNAEKKHLGLGRLAVTQQGISMEGLFSLVWSIL